MGSDVMKGTCDDGGGDTGLCRLSILVWYYLRWMGLQSKALMG